MSSSSSSSNKRSREREEEKKNDYGGSEGEPEAKKNLKFDDDDASYNLPEAPPVPPARAFKLRPISFCPRDKRRTNDEIHSSIQLGPVITDILDTPPMQRLRGLKQLGTADHVFVNVNHNRLEHSLGVAHLAEMLCERIRTNQPSLQCTAKDVLCVKLAGLLHDIGHGPFSHSFEDFVGKHHPKYLRKHPECQQIYRDHSAWPQAPGSSWNHESASLMMIDAALAHLGLEIDLDNLDAPLKQIGDGVEARSMRVSENGGASTDPNMILTSRDFVFVKECIWGKPIGGEVEKKLGPGYHGRTAERQYWLYDIVSNRHSGLDVDKVDYYARDQRRAFRGSGEIDKVMIEEAVVAWAACTDPNNCPRCQLNGSAKGSTDKKHLMICYPDKLIGASMEFFKTRFTLHSKIYKHKTNEAVAFMISDILCLADPHFLVPITPLTGNNSNQGAAKKGYDSLPLSLAMMEPGSYLRLRDSVIDQIAATTSPELEPARNLIDRLWKRDLYKCVAIKVLCRQNQAIDHSIWEKSEDDIVRDILHFADDGIELDEEDIIVHKCEIHHGQKDRDPLTMMRFLEKGELNKIAAEDYKNLPKAVVVDEGVYAAQLPRALMECSLRIYCRDSSKRDDLDKVFSSWWTDIHSEMETAPAQSALLVTQDTDGDGDDDDLMENGDFDAQSPRFWSPY